jgi:Fe-S cluster assembly protein SufD
MNTASIILPTVRDENWRYAALRPVSQLDWSQSPPTLDTETESNIAARLPARLPNSIRLVLFAGRLVPSLSDPLSESDSRGIQLESIDGASSSTISTVGVDQRFAALNRRHATQILRLTISTQPTDRAIELVHVGSGINHPAIEIVLAEKSSAQIIERQLSLDALASATNLRVAVSLGDHASLQLARLLQASTQTHFLETIEIALGQRAALDYTQISLSAATSRSTALIEHSTDSQVSWHASAVGEARQVFDHYVLTCHRAQGASTQQVFRGIASQQARLAFNGHMHVAKTGERSDLQQSLKCLLDGSQAEANLRPQLEIYTDAVSASHGATVGKLDRDMLFYLLSRGIEPQTAESLLKWAFVSDVLAKAPSALRSQIELALLDRLPGAIASQSINQLASQTTHP